MPDQPSLEDGEWEDEAEQTTDEANLGSIITGPGEVEEASLSISTEPLPETQVEMSESEATEDEEEPLPEFDPRFKEDFEGLLYIGRLTDEFTWLGHTFTIRTLTTDEVLEIGLLHRNYSASLADVKAYQAAVVAACVVDVDGQSLPVPITNEVNDTELLNKFRFVKQKWFPPVIDEVYEQYVLLEARANAVIEAMGKASG